MANGKFSNGKRSNLKPVALLLAIALMVGTAVGGTLAWLTDNSGPKVNTFTVGNIDIELDETEEPYKMIPGFTIHKDPKVTVKAVSEKAYVFVEVAESQNFDDFMTYEIADGWTKLSGNEKTAVYYRVQEDIDTDVTYSVLKDDQVKVLHTVTKSDMDALTDATRPTLTFTAYAVQYFKTNGQEFTPAEAWATAKPPVTP